MGIRSTNRTLGRSLKLPRFVFASLLIVPIAFGQTALTTAQIAKRVAPSVVVIQGKTDSGNVLGSGFIVSKDGKIATNLHVIRDMKTASVQLANGKMFGSVSVLATDERRDLAIVQIAGFDLPALDLGDSDAITIGEPLIIVGSPRGLEGTVTAGILSSVRDSGEGFKVLQTDAAVNPGNSGGPLVNNKGHAIGVVSFQLRSTQGLNFAVPINYVQRLLTSLHPPLTLEQMRKGLPDQRRTDQQANGLSLQDTLDWLKESLPLGSIHTVVSEDPICPTCRSTGAMVSITMQPKILTTDSCTLVIGDVESSSGRDGVIITTNSYTVPLRLLTRCEVWHSREVASKGFTVVSGDRIGHQLFLATDSKEILSVSYTSDREGSLSRPDDSATERTDVVNILFRDESLAQRIAKALLHASDLCRKKEPF